jgi:hypothetical protein
MLAAIKAVSDTHASYGRHGITSKNCSPFAIYQAHQGPLNHCASRDVTREFSPHTAVRNNCPSGRMVIRIHARALRTENWRMS